MSIEEGQLAPDFCLLNQDGHEVSLSAMRGQKNVVVYFYPKALTPGCTTQACGMRDVASDLDKLDTVVLGLSPDPVKKLAKFKEKHDLNFDLLSDEDHSVAEDYGVWALKKFMGKEYMGIVRTTFIVDKQGKVARVMDKFKTTSHDQDVLNELAKL